MEKNEKVSKRFTSEKGFIEMHLIYLIDVFEDNKRTTMVRSSAAFNVWNMELLIMKGMIKNSFLIKIVH